MGEPFILSVHLFIIIFVYVVDEGVIEYLICPEETNFKGRKWLEFGNYFTVKGRICFFFSFYCI